MSCLGKISFFVLELLLFILVSLGVTKGLQYMASEHYSPGDSPHRRFQLVVAEQQNTVEKGLSYVVYQWDMLEELKKRIPPPVFFLAEPSVRFQERNGAHVALNVVDERQGEQVIEVVWISDDDKIVNRYRVTEKAIMPLSFRRVSTGLAKRGILTGFVVMALSAVPLYRSLAALEKKALGGDTQA